MIVRKLVRSHSDLLTHLKKLQEKSKFPREEEEGDFHQLLEKLWSQYFVFEVISEKEFQSEEAFSRIKSAKDFFHQIQEFKDSLALRHTYSKKNGKNYIALESLLQSDLKEFRTNQAKVMKKAQAKNLPKVKKLDELLTDLNDARVLDRAQDFVQKRFKKIRKYLKSAQQNAKSLEQISIWFREIIWVVEAMNENAGGLVWPREVLDSAKAIFEVARNWHRSESFNWYIENRLRDEEGQFLHKKNYVTFRSDLEDDVIQLSLNLTKSYDDFLQSVPILK